MNLHDIGRVRPLRDWPDPFSTEFWRARYDYRTFADLYNGTFPLRTRTGDPLDEPSPPRTRTGDQIARAVYELAAAQARMRPYDSGGRVVYHISPREYHELVSRFILTTDMQFHVAGGRIRLYGIEVVVD